MSKQHDLAQIEEELSSNPFDYIGITSITASINASLDVLAIAKRLKLPIRFIAVGEGIEDFDVFNASDFAEALIASKEQ